MQTPDAAPGGADRTAGSIRLVQLTKSFGPVPAVDGIDLEIASGEFFSLLGPSGCGKTTTLRMIAGFEEPTSGQILLDGRDVSTVPPHKRPVNTIFQNYALFPFLSVADNVAFGLRYQGVSKQEARTRVAEALAMVRLSAQADRKPSHLSGGQQQRVALARGLVLNPTVLLLDEPLGALDAQLRKDLQLELKSLQERVGITFVYVTHDQEEALTMSDRLAVMSNGRVEQVGTPQEVYERPTSAFVASFLGAANVLDVEPLTGGTARLAGAVVSAAGDGAALVVRPERVRITTDGELSATVDRLMFLGSVIDVHCVLADGQQIVARVDASGGSELRRGSQVRLAVPPDAARLVAATA